MPLHTRYMLAMAGSRTVVRDRSRQCSEHMTCSSCCRRHMRGSSRNGHTTDKPRWLYLGSRIRRPDQCCRSEALRGQIRDSSSLSSSKCDNELVSAFIFIACIENDGIWFILIFDCRIVLFDALPGQPSGSINARPKFRKRL